MLGKSQLEKARADVDKAREDAAGWHARKAATTRELVELESRAGEDVLASGEGAEEAASRLAIQIATLRASIDIADRTIAAAERRVKELDRRTLAAEAEEVAAKAAELEQNADKRDARTSELLSQLRAHEGTDYAPTVLPSIDGLVGPAVTAQTRTQAMRAEAAGLRQQVAVLRHVAETGLVPEMVPGQLGVYASWCLTDSLKAFPTERAAEAARLLERQTSKAPTAQTA